MVVGAYIIALLLEIGGLVVTVRDVRRAQRASVRLAHPPESEPVTSQEAARSPGGSIAMRRHLKGMERDRQQADRHLEDVLRDVLPAGGLRPYLGPGLIALGIIIGAVATIAG